MLKPVYALAVADTVIVPETVPGKGAVIDTVGGGVVMGTENWKFGGPNELDATPNVV